MKGKCVGYEHFCLLFSQPTQTVRKHSKPPASILICIVHLFLLCLEKSLAVIMAFSLELNENNIKKTFFSVRCSSIEIGQSILCCSSRPEYKDIPHCLLLSCLDVKHKMFNKTIRPPNVMAL